MSMKVTLTHPPVRGLEGQSCAEPDGRYLAPDQGQGQRGAGCATTRPQAVARFVIARAASVHATRFPATWRRPVGALSPPVPRSDDGQMGACTVQSGAHRDWRAVRRVGALLAAGDSCAGRSGFQSVASWFVADRAACDAKKGKPRRSGACAGADVAAYVTNMVAAGCAYGTDQDGVNALSGVTSLSATVTAAKAAIDSWCWP